MIITILYNENGWILTSHNGGLAYEIKKIINGKEKSVYLQGDDALQLASEIYDKKSKLRLKKFNLKPIIEYYLDDYSEVLQENS